MAAMFSKDEIFQLTPSRRATEQLLAENEQLIISTHALTEGDPLYQDSDENYQAFQLTPSRRATASNQQKLYGGNISTHALTEGDWRIRDTRTHRLYFNSRPHGGRLPEEKRTLVIMMTFQLTPSRRATEKITANDLIKAFQLTPSRRATSLCRYFPLSRYFNSRPHGGRRPFRYFLSVRTVFQLTPSRRATDTKEPAMA